MLSLKRVISLGLGLLLNLGISSMILNSNLWHVKNYQQPLFQFGFVGLICILGLLYVLVIKLGMTAKYPVLISIIWVGIVCNVVEKLYLGFVVDYLDFGIGIVNIADLQIYIGCGLIIAKEFGPCIESK